MRLARFFGTICIISRVNTVAVTLDKKTRLQEVPKIEEQDGHKEKQRARFNIENKCQVEHACFTALKGFTWKYFKTFSANENVELY